MSHHHKRPLKQIRPGFESHIDNEKFKPGAIRRIDLHNFVTYSDVVFTPGPNLNLIVGPNGSGKSSIVAAICLGLGGHPNCLGRSEKVGSFIKRGCESGFIKIALYTPETKSNRTTIRRSITRDNKSTWHIDGVLTKKELVDSQVRRNNIQVDNLCQFLAQEKVSDFARLDGVNLLAQTELAVNDSILKDQHEQLVCMNREMKTINENLSALDLNIVRLEKDKETLGREVKRCEEREKFQIRLSLLNKKMPWVKLEIIKDEFREAKAKHLEAKAAFELVEASLAPKMQRLKTLRTSRLNLDKNRVKNLKISNRFSSIITNHKDDIENIDNEVQQCDENLNGIDERFRIKQKAHQTTQKVIIENETKLSEMHSPEQFLSKITKNTSIQQKVDFEFRASQLKATRLAREIHNIESRVSETKKQIQNLEDANHRREQALFSKGYLANSTRQMKHWLDNGGLQQCQSRVAGPLALEISVDVKGIEQYVETMLPYSLRMAFVVESDKDFAFLSAIADKNAWKIVILSVSHSKPLSKHRDLPPHCFWLEDGVSAPDLVMLALRAENVLNVVYTKHNIDVESVLSSSPNDNRPKRLFTPTTLYSVKFSRYGQHNRNISTQKLQAASLFVSGIDEAHMQDLNDEYTTLNTKKNELIVERTNLDETLRTQTNNRRDTQSTLTHLRQAKKQREVTERVIQQLRDSLVDARNANTLQSEKLQFREEISRLNSQRLSLCQSLLQNYQNYLHACHELDVSCLAMTHTEELVRLSQANCQEEDQMLQNKREIVVAAKNERKLIGTRMKKQHEMALQVSDPAQLIQEFAELPDSMEEIDDEIAELQSRIANVVGDINVRERFDKVLSQLETHLHQRDLNSHNQIGLRAKSDSLKKVWMAKLNEVVNGIDSRYQQYFARLRCRGCIKIRQDEDFEKWGLDIVVSFRDKGEMHSLDGSMQSGGEKSVATMMYLLALQEVTTCPFRVVDEINQGMDASFERKVFNQIVECSSGELLPQYFVVTPKLLPNLQFNDSIRTLVVMNGAWNLPQMEMNLWDQVQDKLKRKKKLRLSSS